MSDASCGDEGFERVIAFEGIHNVRDLGGYPTRYGRPTRPRTVFRAASLVNLTPADRELLRGLGVAHVFDLRSFPEIGRDGFVDLDEIGARRVHAPIFPDTDVSPEALVERRKLYAVDFSRVYLMMLREGAPSIRRIVQAIGSEQQPVLFHCAGGKDRTGVVAAVLLSLAGVDRETIMKDYALTSEHLPTPDEDRIREGMARMGLTRDEFMTMLGANPEDMANTLDGIAREYGTVEDYLRSIGLSDDEIDRAREQLLSESGGGSE